jgi:nucleoside-triphosphatase
LRRLVFLTGKPRVGKTTALKRIVSSLTAYGYVVGGMLTLEINEKGVRTGFEISDILSGRKGVLAHITGEGPSIGRYHVNLQDLAEVGARALDIAVEQATVIAVDEIGPMELLSPRFKASINKAFDSGKPLVGTIHYRSREPYIERIRSRNDVNIIEVTMETRERLPMMVVDSLKQMLT